MRTIDAELLYLT